MIIRNARGVSYDIAETWDALPEGTAKIDELVRAVEILGDNSDSRERKLLAAAIVTLAKAIRSTQPASIDVIGDVKPLARP